MDVTIKNSQIHTVLPTYDLKNANVCIEFNVSKSPFLFTDLRNSTLSLRVKALKSDGTSIPSTEEFSVINFLHHTLFKSCSILINGKSIEHHASEHFGLR